MPAKIRYRQNGTGNAFLREIGCSCPQCSSGKSKPQTSGSLLIEAEDEASARSLKFHLLFDCGLGVVDSVLDAGITKVTHVFISHNHPDHCLELDRLFQSQMRSGRRSGLNLRIPCYCTAGTRKTGPDHLFPYLKWVRIDVAAGMPVVPEAYSSDGAATEPGLGIGLTITPVAVYHGNPDIVPEPVIWVVEFNSSEGRRKIVLAWDLLHFVPRYKDEDRDEVYQGPSVEGGELDPSHEILRGADLLVLEGNTWEPCPKSGHTSVVTGLDVTVPLLRPKKNGEVWFVHYSGHEDKSGPMSDDQLAEQISARAKKNGIPSNVRLAAPGDELVYA